MGGEVLIIPAAVLGAISLALLVFLSRKPSKMPYALPTLIFSLVSAFFMASTGSLSNFVVTFFGGFFLAAVVFGVHAMYIKLLNERNT